MECRSYRAAASSDAQWKTRGHGTEAQEAQLPTHPQSSLWLWASEGPITHLANSKLGEPWEPDGLALTTMGNDLCEVILQ